MNSRMFNRLRINAHGRLIEQQELGVMQQCATEIDATFHAAGIILHRVLRAIGERECFKQFRGARFCIAGTQAAMRPQNSRFSRPVSSS